MSYSVKIAEPHVGREVTFTAPTAEEAVRMARSWSPTVGPLGTTYPPLGTYHRSSLADVIPCGKSAEA